MLKSHINHATSGEAYTIFFADKSLCPKTTGNISNAFRRSRSIIHYASETENVPHVALLVKQSPFRVIHIVDRFPYDPEALLQVAMQNVHRLIPDWVLQTVKPMRLQQEPMQLQQEPMQQKQEQQGTIVVSGGATTELLDHLANILIGVMPNADFDRCLGSDGRLDISHLPGTYLSNLFSGLSEPEGVSIGLSCTVCNVMLVCFSNIHGNEAVCQGCSPTSPGGW